MNINWSHETREAFGIFNGLPYNYEVWVYSDKDRGVEISIRCQKGKCLLRIDRTGKGDSGSALHFSFHDSFEEAEQAIPSALRKIIAAFNAVLRDVEG